ncbi:tRNA-guanine(15) transglycosylase-like protein [Radiomyces spectabilis]|uniref:tRNA-guanine(15) transglycosylase-like protein n=1 Tax=Radiomyces spectabilis TaxID=64574 RepID=UPI00222002DB|nr:tRNA-guanine(15) transglycosylase-like protein [Radiomyces spectabilis]KAI8364698.1 tRNA-guanine(15) transglycosylase-like protein [Radiomyces spectabilis]
MRDPLKSVPISFNTDKYLSVDTHGGVRQVTPDVWAQAMEAYQPDLCASMCDFVTDEDAKLKRIKRSVDRTLRWLDTCKSKADSLEIPLFAPVVGSDSAEERKRSAIETAQRDVQGFILNVFGLKNEDLESLIRASVDQLPASKPRLAYGLATPENILRGVANGIDLFDGSYAYKVTQRGHAITFKFGDQLTESSKDKQAKTLSLWRTELNRSFEPLDASCGCYSCTAPHTKAYIHHLLNAHEMLGPLLLMSHNLHQLHEFMASIRRSIEGNRFDQDVEAFLKHYEQDKDAKKDEEHSDEIDAESLGVPLKKKRTLLL